MPLRFWVLGLPAVLSLALSSVAANVDDEPLRPVKVFLLAGQSNMEGQGVVDLDHPDHYNGGKGTLEHVMRMTDKPELYAGVKDANGAWTVREDVWIRFKTSRELKRGDLSIGFAGYPGRHHIGPEFQFGRVVGDQLDSQILLIKTAWGGKSLHKDFRPPSAGGEVGPFYNHMIEEVKEALERLPDEFPEYGGRGYEIGGFVWFQGWNDMFDEQARSQYEVNLVCLINDVRREFERPNLPVVIGQLGNGGPEASPNMLAIRRAQAAAANRPEFAGTVRFVETTDFARPAAESPNRGHGHHWFGNAESYFLIGDALGLAMLALLEK